MPRAAKGPKPAMRYVEALRIWNNHRKRIDPAHVWALPRKGTPEHGLVKSIQMGDYKIKEDAIVKARAAAADIKTRMPPPEPEEEVKPITNPMVSPEKLKRALAPYKGTKRILRRKKPVEEAPAPEPVAEKTVLERYNEFVSGKTAKERKALTEKVLYYTGKGSGAKAGHAFSMDEARRIVMGELPLPGKKRGPKGPREAVQRAAAPERRYTREELEGMKFPDLLDLVRERKFKGHSGLRKDGMVEFFLKKQEGGDVGGAGRAVAAGAAVIPAAAVRAVQVASEEPQPMIPTAVVGPVVAAEAAQERGPRVVDREARETMALLNTLSNRMVGVGRTIPTAEPRHMSRTSEQNPMLAQRLEAARSHEEIERILEEEDAKKKA